MDIGSPTQSLDPLMHVFKLSTWNVLNKTSRAKTITVKDIQLLTQTRPRRGFARQYYVKFRVGDSNSSWRTKGAKEIESSITLDGNWSFDGDDHSVLIVDIYQKHHIGNDKVIVTLGSTVGKLLRKSKDGDLVLEETLGVSGSGPGITIRFSFTAESREGPNVAALETPEVPESPDPTPQAVAEARVVLESLHHVPNTVDQSIAMAGTGASIATELQTLQTTWGVLLHRLGLFNKIVADVAAVHPYTTLAWSIISSVTQVLVNQKNRDDQIHHLARMMSEVFSFVEEAEPLKKIMACLEIITRLSQQVDLCAKFIVEYAQQKSFWIRAGKYTISDIDAKIADHENTLRGLKTEFMEQVILKTGVTVVGMKNVVEHAAERVDLDDIPYALGARHVEEEGCLPGTRASLISEICAILDNPAEDAPRVYLLTGVAGSGKSAVANSIAQLYEEQKKLGSSFFFSRDHIARRNPANLFSTIARDLSDRDPQYKSALWKIVKGKQAIRRSMSPADQFKHLIIEPSKHLVLRPLVIVVDALDESSDMAGREHLLKVISEQFTKSTLPTGLRFLITSRPEQDVVSSFPPNPQLVHKQMGDIPEQTVEGDIEKFIYHSLGEISELESSWPNREWCRILVYHSHHLFQWARAARDFIQGKGAAALRPRERLELLVKGSDDESVHPLDSVYRTVLKTVLERDFTLTEARRRYNTVMGIILSLYEPLSLASLEALFGDSMEVREVLKPLGPLLDGVLDENRPIRPLHSSFRDFLLDSNRSHSYHVVILPKDSLSLGQKLFARTRNMLEVSMYDLKDFRLRNVNVPHLEHQVNNIIPPYLSYSCRYWMHHLQHVHCTSALLDEITFFFKNFFLSWVEAISLLCLSSPRSPILPALETCTILRTWAKDHDSISVLSSEAFKFIQTFSPILSDSTPHFYLGFSRFFLAPCFDDLRRAAEGGPVIIVNASKDGCDALIVLRTHALVRVPLCCSFNDVVQLCIQLSDLTQDSRAYGLCREFYLKNVLRKLWSDVVERIVYVLQTDVQLPPGSRIWWCPTSEFTSLPLHAAGPHREGQKNLMDIYVSSYAPSLSALIRARDRLRSQRKAHDPSGTQLVSFAMVGQAHPSADTGLCELPEVEHEIQRIRDETTTPANVRFEIIAGVAASIEGAAQAFRGHRWVHVACHSAHHAEKPLDSGLVMGDGKLTLMRIIQEHYTNSEFAFLSACHTAKGDASIPGRVLNLATGMQLAGFSGVIGALWEVDDAVVHRVVTRFYREMFKHLNINFEHAAAALNTAVIETAGEASLEKRIVFVHIGI